MRNIQLDSKAFFAVLGLAVVVAAILVYRGANATQKVPLPDPNMFKSGSAKTAHT